LSAIEEPLPLSQSQSISPRRTVWHIEQFDISAGRQTAECRIQAAECRYRCLAVGASPNKLVKHNECWMGFAQTKPTLSRGECILSLANLEVENLVKYGYMSLKL